MNAAKLALGSLCALVGIGLMIVALGTVYGVLVGHPYGWQKDEVTMMMIGTGLFFVSLVALGTRKPPARVLRSAVIVYAVVVAVCGASLLGLEIRRRVRIARVSG
jgi:hypothetical protein